MSKKIKTFAIVALILAVIIAVSAYVAGSGTAKTSSSPRTLTSSTGSKAAGVSTGVITPTQQNDFSTLLSTVKGIAIDTSVFENPAYKALRDYPIALGIDTVGRPNPFAPIGYDIADAPVAKQVQFETLQPSKIKSTSAEFAAQAILSDTTQTNVVFEYGLNDTFGNATPPIPVTKNGAVLYTAKGLTPGTTYSVRAVLAQGSNITTGNTMVFTTTGTAPKP